MVDPRWLDAEAAAHYLRIGVDGFRRRVREGRIPPPSRALGPRDPRWDRAALDAAMGGGTASLDPEQAAQAIAEEIAARRPQRHAHAGRR